VAPVARVRPMALPDRVAVRLGRLNPPRSVASRPTLSTKTAHAHRNLTMDQIRLTLLASLLGMSLLFAVKGLQEIQHPPFSELAIKASIVDT